MVREEKRKTLGRMHMILLRPFRLLYVRDVGHILISISVCIGLYMYIFGKIIFGCFRSMKKKKRSETKE